MIGSAKHLLLGLLATTALAAVPFEADPSVAKAIANVVAHAEASIKKADPKTIGASFPATQDAGVAVHIFKNFPVSPIVESSLISGRNLLQIGYGHRL